MRAMLRFAVLLACMSTVAMPVERLVSHSHADKAAADPAWSELAASMEKMHETAASLGPSGNSDVDFVRLMLPHHQATIDMAKIQLTRGKDPQMRRLAQEIITDQQSEIELMRLWLRRLEPKSGERKNTPVLQASKKQ